MTEIEQGLINQVVAVPESRQLDVLAEMIEKRGGRVIRCPLVSIYDAPDPQPVEIWLNNFLNTRFDALIILTGEGIRRLTVFAERRGKKEAWVAALASVHKICRGPKPGAALREIGLSADQLAAAPTTDGVIETLETMPLEGKKIAVQLYGTEPNEKLITFLQHQQVAQISTVAPYIYASDAEDASVKSLIESMIKGEVNVIAFTSQPQLRRLISVAKANLLEQELIAALQQMHVAAVGPVIETELQKLGISVAIRPETSFFMKPMIRKMVEVLG